MTKQKNEFIFSAIALAVLVLPKFSQAAGLVPCGGPGESICNIEFFFIAIARVTNFLIAVAGVYAAFQIIGGGWWLIVSQGNEEAIAAKKSQISTAIIGFVFVMLSYVFVNTAVNYILMSKCKVDISNPLNYLTVNSEGIQNCQENPGVPSTKK